MTRHPPSGTSIAPGSVRPLSASDILALHEAGAGLDPIERALLAVSFRDPGTARNGHAALPLGARDRMLLDLHRATFGSAVDASADCPACAARLDIPLDASALVVETDPAAPREVARDGWHVTVRPLDTADLLRAARCPDANAAARLLADAAIVSASRGDGPVAPDGLPAAVIAAAGEAVAALDPMAEIVLDVACPACGGVSPLAVEVATFLWEAIDRAAHGLFDEVAALAGRYGWSEADVLAMSPARRHRYLAAVG